jgi:hypothetical protein
MIISTIITYSRITITITSREISGSRGGEDKYDSFLRCSAQAQNDKNQW